MPSLNELNQFKSSFHNISNEKKDLESLNLTFDDLQLPAKEAPPFNYSRDMPYSNVVFDAPDITPDSDAADLSAVIPDLPDTPADAPSGLSAFDDLLKDLSPGGAEPEEDLSFADTVDSALPDEDISSAEEDLLPDFPDEEVPEESQPVDFQADDSQLADFQTDDLTSDELPDFDIEDLSGGQAPQWSDDEIPQDDFSSAGLPDFDIDGADGAGLPQDDFSGAELPDFDIGEDSEIPQEPLRLDDLPDFGESIDLGGESPPLSALPDEPFPDIGDSLPDFDLVDGSIDLGGESPALNQTGDDVSADDSLPDFGSGLDSQLSDFQPEDFQSEDFPSDDFASADFPTEDFASGDFPSDDFQPAASEDSSSPDSSIPGFDDSMFDLSQDTGGTPLDADFDLGGDGIDFTPAGDQGLGDFGSDFASDSIDLGAGEAPAEEQHADVFGSDDFSLAGLDDILSKSKVGPVPETAPKKKGLFGKKKEKAEQEPEADDDVEEISLKQDDVDKLLQTLSLYPLNLRIICEELIAEQVILPQQLSKLIRLLVSGAHVKETALHVESITGKPVVIPKSFEKMTGAAFEAEQSSFGYIFVHNFLPVLRLFAFIAAVAGSVLYLGYNFIYIPMKAESIYQRGYERIPAGEYQRANELFQQAFALNRKKKWFYSYAEAFRDQRRYSLAEGKYDELLRYYPRDKKGVLDYAGLNTYYLMNYEKANRLLQRELLDYAPNDYDGLLAAGDNFLSWADSDPSRFYDKYEDARFSYARLIELNGMLAPVLERMMKYFIRTDNLKETLQLRAWFENNPKNKLTPVSLAELGGYLLDKQLEKPTGVPDAYIESIASVRAMLLQAVMEEPTLPEPHYHLARYYKNLNNTHEERKTLENAIRAFNLAKTESVRRRQYRVDTHYRYANLLINEKEFFPAEEQVIRGIELYEDFVNRNLIAPSPQLGQLYALSGDFELFVKTGNMEAALANYRAAERYGYSPPEIQYRMGSAYYQQEDWRNALEYLFKASSELPLNRRILFALGNAAYQRGDYFASQGYYNRLLDVLENQRIRLPVLLPNDSAQFLETGERLMMARNNLGVVYEALADQTGNRQYRSDALVMYAESARSWDAITRNPEYMTRMRLADSPGAPSINLGYLNANNALRPNSTYNPQIFPRIDKDVLEPSKWEELTRY